MTTLDEFNRYWTMWVDEYYQNTKHEGLEGYYKSQGWEVPQNGPTPLQDWNRDSRRLTFLDTALVAEAFLHHTTRVVDKSGCLSFGGRQYEVSVALIGAKVEVSYDPMATETLTVRYPGIPPITAKPIIIGEYCDPKPSIPASMQPVEPQTSRLLDVVEKKHEARQQLQANAISFSNYRKEAPKGGEENV